MPRIRILQACQDFRLGPKEDRRAPEVRTDGAKDENGFIIPRVSTYVLGPT